jgi:Ca2+-binding RTX toxin-like protein
VKNGFVLTVTVESGVPATLKRSGELITLNGVTCTADAKQPTVAEIDTININEQSAGGNQEIILDLSGGKFVPGANLDDVGSDDIEFNVNLGSGSNTLRLLGSTAGDRWTFLSAGIDMNSDGDADVRGNNGGALNPAPPAAPTVAIVADGGQGGDTFVQKEITTETLIGSEGPDRVDYCVLVSTNPDTCTRSGAVNVTLDGLAADGSVASAEKDNVSSSVERVNGGDGGDTLTGTPQADALFGYGGVDTLNDGPNDAEPLVDTGADTLNGGLGGDFLNAGDGGDLLRGGGGEDDLKGDLGKDNLNGGSDADQEDGGDGRDYFDQEDAANGGDTLIGGDGNDTLSYSRRDNTVDVTIGAGDDDGEANEQDDVAASMENVRGGAGGDTLDASGATGVAHNLSGGAAGDTITGSNLADTLSGGDGADIIHGLAGGDNVFGSEGGDDLFGEDGNDNLSGQNGSDDLSGGEGRDRLLGGAGTDSCADPQSRTHPKFPTLRSNCESS